MPLRVFIVRHGEREDHVDPTWAQKQDRPQDPSLTERGKEMARQLGQYVCQGHEIPLDVDPSKVVIFSSPMKRCVQTSHGIAEGIMAASAAATADAEGSSAATAGAAAAGTVSPPQIRIEESLVEGMKWLGIDIKRRRELLENKKFMPLWNDAAYHQQHHSPLVQLPKDSKAPGSGSMVPVPITYSGNYFLEGDAKAIPKDPKDRAFEYSTKQQEIRCLAGRRALDKLEADTEAVFLVTHGSTCQSWLRAFMGRRYKDVKPDYTSFTELQRKNGNDQQEEEDGEEDSEGDVPYFLYGAPWRQPHLA